MDGWRDGWMEACGWLDQLTIETNGWVGDLIAEQAA